jgi:HlyD family secretion protein
VKKLLLVLIVLGLLLAGGAWWLSRPQGPAVTESLFTYAPVERGDIADTVSGTGVIQPREVLLVVSDTPGTAVEVAGKVNDVVGEGDVLLRLDDRRQKLKVQEADDGVDTAKASLLQAEAGREAAELALRYQLDIEKKGGFRSERDQAEVKVRAARAGVEVAKAQLRSAQTQRKEAQLALDLTVVKVPTAPEAGTAQRATRRREYLVLERKVEPGQTVGPQSPAPLFTLAGDLAVMEVHTEIAEGDIDRVRKGLPAVFTISSSSEPDRQFRGTVKQIRPTPASVKGAVFYNAVLDVANQKNAATEEWWLRPGMTASVDIVRAERKGVWKVPSAALSVRMDEAYVTEEAAARLAEWQKRPDRGDWRPVWVWSESKESPWPVFLRLTDAKAGRAGIKAGEFHEVLEWEPGWPPAGGFRVITDAPPARAPGLFEQPAGIKVS